MQFEFVDDAVVQHFKRDWSDRFPVPSVSGLREGMERLSPEGGCKRESVEPPESCKKERAEHLAMRLKSKSNTS